MGDTMTARVYGNPSNALCTGEWVALQDAVDGQLWDRFADRWEDEPEPEQDPSDYRKQQIESRLAEDDLL